MLEVEVKTSLDSIKDAVEDIRDGKVVIVVDDEDRENEGDFICAAEKITPEIINFMARYGRGLICTPITEQRAKELKLNNMVSNNTDLHGTAFTVSIDYKKKGCTTGISAYDRATGIKAISDLNTDPDDFARPGHIFPLVAKEGGVLRRTGHTEAAIDLAKLAGLYPSGVLVEILNEDGSMARLPELKVIAENLDLKLISIKDLVAYRMKQERLVVSEMSVKLNTQYGEFDLHSFKETNSQTTHLCITKGKWEADEPIFCRVHSATQTTDLFSLIHQGSENVIQKSLEKISNEKKGVLLIMMPEHNHLDITKLLVSIKEHENINDAISHLTNDHTNKQRDLGIGAQILYELGVRKIKLLTRSSSVKRVGLIGYGLEIVENIEI